MGTIRSDLRTTYTGQSQGRCVRTRHPRERELTGRTFFPQLCMGCGHNVALRSSRSNSSQPSPSHVPATERRKRQT
eukprot:124935-Prorocentrum_minimum.AAC.4